MHMVGPGLWQLQEMKGHNSHTCIPDIHQREVLKLVTQDQMPCPLTQVQQRGELARQLSLGMGIDLTLDNCAHRIYKSFDTHTFTAVS